MIDEIIPPELLPVLALPLAAAALLVFVRSYALAAGINVAACLMTAGLAARLAFVDVAPTIWFQLDVFNTALVVLNAAVVTSAAVFSVGYMAMARATGRVESARLRYYHAIFQAMNFAMLLALSANNIGLMWVAMEAATVATVTMVALYRTRPAIEAAWKYFILASIGIALALFGTIVTYFAARPATIELGLGDAVNSMAWDGLLTVAPTLNPYVLSVAFVFLLVGYGTKAGLVPLHSWLPDAHAEGPTPIVAVLSGLLLNVALYALLRFKIVVDANGAAVSPGPLMASLGILSVLLGGLMLYRRRDVKRLFSYSSIEHVGICAVAFGIGGSLANMAGLLHMMLHALTKSAIFYCVGHGAQLKGTQRTSDVRGLTVSHPLLGWTLFAGIVAIAGLPPFGLFRSEFMLILAVMGNTPVLLVPLGLGLLIALGGLILQAHSLCFGAPSPTPALRGKAVEAARFAAVMALVPAALHLLIVLIAGIWLPASVASWFKAVGAMLG